MRKEQIQKAWAFAKIAEHALSLAEDEEIPYRKRMKAHRIAKNYFKHAETILERKYCLWWNSSTNKKGEFEMPKACQAKGCKGFFNPGEELKECYEDIDTLLE